MDPETYRDMSATKVITADTYNDDGYPIDMGLMDPRLGVIDPGLECRTCGSHSGPVTATSATSSWRPRSFTSASRSSSDDCSARRAGSAASSPRTRSSATSSAIRYERAKELGNDEQRRVEGCRPAGPEGVDVSVLR